MPLSDAICEFLGIPLEEQPVSYYRLLGVSPGEPDSEVIENAAYRQMMRVRAACAGPLADEPQRLLNLLAAARVCLLDPVCRRAYDESREAAAALPDGEKFGWEPPETAPPGDQTRVSHSSAAAAGEIAPTAPGGLEPEGQTVWTLGADKNCDIVIDDPYVSRRHCRIVLEEGKYWVEDLDSCNGTFLNSERVVRRKEIALDDSIGLGKTLRIAWSQFVEKQRQLRRDEVKPLIVHVARRTVRRSEGCPVLPFEESSTQLEPPIAAPSQESTPGLAPAQDSWRAC